MAKTSSKTLAERAAAQPESAGLYDDFLPYLVTRLAHQLNTELVETLRRKRINLARWRILAVLAMGDGITINEIADRAMMQQSALSRALMKMETEDYVVRAPRRQDSRYVEVFLTDKGRSLFEALDPLVRLRQKRLLDGLSAAEVATAFRLIRRLLDNSSA